MCHDLLSLLPSASRRPVGTRSPGAHHTVPSTASRRASGRAARTAPTHLNYSTARAMAAEAATPARADVVDEVFQERGITEPTPPAPAEPKPPVPPIAAPEGEEQFFDAKSPTTPRKYRFALDELPPSPSMRKKGITSPTPAAQSPVVKAFEANLEEMQKWRKRALDAESKLWGSAREQSLAFQAASKWKGFKKGSGTPPSRSKSPARSRSPQRYSRDNASEARRLAKKLLGELEGLGEDHASIRASLRWQLKELAGVKSTSPPPASRSAGIFEDFKASPRARRTPSVRTPSDYVISGKRRSHYEKAIAAARTVGTRRKERASFGSPPHKRASAKAPVST